ncbi:MAG: PDZ domain-containing protein [Phycisphaeraceae bacterium]|nr:PDZ domain-containing protein [Phycisphaeraceae bacterium]
MIRLYAPERFWTLRNDRRIAEGLSPLPPYNPTADGWQVKTEGISWPMVAGAIQRGAERYVERHRAGMKEMLIGGLDGVRTLVEFGDVRGVFTGLADDAKRAEFLQYLTLQSNAVAEATVRLSREDLDKTLGAILKFNRSTVAIPDAALLHEFGNGAMARLDPFSRDHLARRGQDVPASDAGEVSSASASRSSPDEQQNIKITTPLDGTPAQRAGIRSGDLIKKVDGISTAGFSLDQAVSVITGAPGKSVTLTIERKSGEEFKSLDISIVRANIDVKTVKGWARTGAGERDWDYFIDRGHGIGYVRLTQFTESTTRTSTLRSRR